MTTPRIFAAGISTETNVFSPMPTGVRDFYVARTGESEAARSAILGGTAFARCAAVVKAGGCEYIQSLYAAAQPGGTTTRLAYESLRDSLLEDLEAALPVDGVLLCLHGAMVADGYEDCETDITQRVRSLAGDQAQIGILLDLHCDLPAELVELADAIVIFKEYPHVDIDDRAGELAALIVDAALGKTKPTMAVYDCRMIGIYPTPPEPMRTFVQGMHDAEGRDGILSVSLAHGFPWGDAPEMSVRMLVVADADRTLARTVAAELGNDFYALRHEVTVFPVPMTAALDAAYSTRPANGPVVVADVADNAGGGAPSDSTYVLRELLARKVENTGVALLWDPIAVQLAFAAGEGATLPIRLGGKTGSFSGDPLDVTVQVRGLVPQLMQRWPQTVGHLEVPSGDCACLSFDGIDVIVGSTRQQVLGLDVFTAFGIDPAAYDVVIVKSANHFRAAFGPIAGDIVYMDAGGALSFDWAAIPYRLFDPSDKYPVVDDPLQSA